MYSTIIIVRFLRPRIFWADFRKEKNFTFHENTSDGSLVSLASTDGRREKHDEANCSFSQFCQWA